METTGEMCMVMSQIRCSPVSQLRGDRGICPIGARVLAKLL